MHRNGLDSTKKSYKNDILLILFFLIIGIGAFAFMQLQGFFKKPKNELEKGGRTPVSAAAEIHEEQR